MTTETVVLSLYPVVIDGHECIQLHLKDVKFNAKISIYVELFDLEDGPAQGDPVWIKDDGLYYDQGRLRLQALYG